ncbi:MAG: transporter substrate-binding protein, partial [Planctomycetota bacterium]
MSACPTFRQIEEYVSGQLSDFDRSAVESHIEACDSCRETALRLKSRRLGSTIQTPPPAPRREAPLPPELVEHPRYHVLELLAVGGMGAVYKAEHRLLERPVVLKVIRPDLLRNSQQAQRFLREARAAARLLHPNIVTLFEAEEIGESHFLVMEYLKGIDLARLVQVHGALPVGEACEWIRQAALGLQHIHEHGLVHRDIKPSNLFLVGTRRIKILDLGLAVLKSEEVPEQALTRAGQCLGTVDYMAPEQWEESHAVDIRADIYSLGCTLYCLLAGKPPFDEDSNTMRKMWSHAHEPAPSIGELRPDVPEPVAAVLAQMLAKRPEDRFTAPVEVAAALEPFATAPPSSAGSISTTRYTPVSATGVGTTAIRFLRRPLMAAGLTAVLLVAGVLAAHFLGVLGKPGDRGDSRAGPVFAGPPIKVGILHSRTGTMAVSERPVIDATLFAIEEINRQGGLLKRKIEAVVEDGASDPATFAQKAEKLITQDSVCTVFGCWTSASRKTVRPIFEKHDHLLFYPVQYEGLEQSPNIVYTGAAPNQQIIPAVRWSCTFQKKKRLFLVGSDYVFPHAANAIIGDQALDLGAEVVGEEYIPLGSADTEGIIEKIQAARPEAILNTINGDSNVAFFRALRAAGITPDSVPTISFSVSEEELAALNPREAEGDYAAWSYFQSIDGPRNREFVRAFRARFGPDRI